MHAAPLLFALYAACHASLALAHVLVNGRRLSIVLAIAIALIYDNGLLSLGRTLFPDASSSSAALRALCQASQPRFILHALLTPLLIMQTATLGARAGLRWLLPGTMACNAASVVSVALALVGTVHHLMDPELVLRQPSKNEPKDAIIRQIVSVTPARPNLLLLAGPAVLVVLWTIVVGACVAYTAAVPGVRAAGHWLWATSVLELLSNAGPPWTMQLTGNAGEVVLVVGFVVAQWLIDQSGACEEPLVPQQGTEPTTTP